MTDFGVCQMKRYLRYWPFDGLVISVSSFSSVEDKGIIVHTEMERRFEQSFRIFATVAFKH
jgi:hypothetical protein